MSLTKVSKMHHSVTENGNIQVRIITEYQDDTGKVLDKKYGDPMTPADTKDMTGWDIESQDIVSAIIGKAVLAEFDLEKQTLTHPERIAGVGIEESISYDRVIDELGRVSVRQITRIFDEGVEVSKKYHRSWIMPGQDPSGNDVMSKAIAEKLHTSEVIATYNTKMTELKAEKL